MYDLHLHSLYSDGDLSPGQVLDEMSRRNIQGVSLTDHNGTWGLAEALAESKRQGMAFIEGVEISVRWEDCDVHLLGYGHSLKQKVLQEGLAATRQGYEERARTMVELCAQVGFDQVSFDSLRRRREGQHEPVFTSYDVARELTSQHGLSVAQARELTTSGGPCHVPYGDWALTGREAIELIHAAGGIAVLAHPGLVAKDKDEETMWRLVDELAAVGLDGLEVIYPYHDKKLTKELGQLATKHSMVVTGGSDWHGPGRYEKSDQAFGEVGLDETGWQEFLARLDQLV